MPSIRGFVPWSCSGLKCLAPSQPTRTVLRAPNRPYHSYEHQDPPPFTPAEEAMLAAGLSHVPTHGFTSTALTLGARDAGYPDVSTNLFPRGPFDLVRYHLVTQRLALKERIQFPHDRLGVGAKVRLLALERLRANQSIIHRWQEVSANVSPTPHHDCTLFPFSFFLARLLNCIDGVENLGTASSACLPESSSPDCAPGRIRLDERERVCRYSRMPCNAQRGLEALVVSRVPTRATYRREPQFVHRFRSTDEESRCGRRKCKRHGLNFGTDALSCDSILENATSNESASADIYWP